jgi:hypothetical protein
MSPTRWPRSTVSPSRLQLKTMRRASSPAICLKVTSTPLAAHRDNVLLVAVGRGRIHGVQILALLIAHRLRTPPMGERFTCTSKTLRKMLIRCRGPRES